MRPKGKGETEPHSGDERFFPMYNIQQQVIGQYSVDKVLEYGDLIHVRWQSAVVGVEQDGERVSVTVPTPEGSRAASQDISPASGVPDEVSGLDSMFQVQSERTLVCPTWEQARALAAAGEDARVSGHVVCRAMVESTT